MSFNTEDLSPISQQIWDMKYRLKRPDGTPVDFEIKDTWNRVAYALAQAETEPERYEAEFNRALSGFKFIPAGRILSGAGTDRNVTLFNCYVMGTIEDDMASIFRHLGEAALTMQAGGGIGYDFSTLRPKGAPVKGVGADASGPLSFMEVWDSMCRTIMSAGSRRGAMMATLRCDHPDIEDFITAKHTPGRLTNFNVSVLVTDAFMAAVEADQEWPLSFGGKVYRTVRAAALWDLIMRSTYEYAEPGVIFIDRVNAMNNLAYCETIAASNPCGEEMLPPYGACLLGSINLAAMVYKPFSESAILDTAELADTVKTAVRMLDNVTTVSRFPLDAQRAEAVAKRRIGLGVTGLADALIMLGLRYGSPAAVAWTEETLSHINRVAYFSSVYLADEKGRFPAFDPSRYVESGFIRTLPRHLRQAIATTGIRNSHLTAIAPTGTISLFADNVSSGLEPVFSFTALRKITMPDGSKREVEISDHAYRLYRQMFGNKQSLTDAFVDAQTLSPDDHLVMQAAAQRHVDTSISKTINCPADLPFDQFANVYLKAYKSGCKGCTTYRPSDTRGSVLSVVSETPKPAEKMAKLTLAPASLDLPSARPEALPGQTYKLKWADSDHALYITVNDMIEDGQRRPFEVFINSKNMEHYAWVVALTRMISAVFRRGGDVTFVVEELKAVFDPRGGAWMRGAYVPSLVAAIGGIIEQHLIEIGFIERAALVETMVALKQAAGGETVAAVSPAQCPKCGQASLTRQGGCDTCVSCGHSKCG